MPSTSRLSRCCRTTDAFRWSSSASRSDCPSPSVIERVKKLEDSGIITGYHATVDARKLGKDVTAFIGVSIAHPKAIATFEHTVALVDDVLECHHVTGEHSLLLKVKTNNTTSLERLISTIRSIEGVSRTETMVVLSTHIERAQISVRTSTATPEPATVTTQASPRLAKTIVADPRRM